MYFFINRFTNAIASKWVFIASCLLLRIVEGVGTAILNTTIFAVFPKLYPKSVGTLVVYYNYPLAHAKLRAVAIIIPQGLFELAGSVGYAMGPSLGGVMYQVQYQ